jgi:tripartite-type tricarboxylate transporter receptor subunit TctC
MLAKIVCTSLTGVLALTATVTASAQDWPTRPVTMIVPFAAGGTTDVLGRIMALRIGEILGQPVVIENVGGAGGMTGSLRVARAQPDGYQILFSGLGAMVLSQALQKVPAYNAATDFAPVSLFAEVPLVLIARKDLPVNNLQEFVSHARANQTKMNFGSSGVGSGPHIGCVLLNAAIGANIAHVPYRGSGPAMQDLIAGRIDYYCDVLPTALSQMEGKTVKGIAILTRNRATVLPDLPTAHEQGLADFEANTWFAFFLPRGTPDAIVRRLHLATIEATNTLAVRERLQGIGVTAVSTERMTPEYLGEFVRSETEKWAKPIKALGLSTD